MTKLINREKRQRKRMIAFGLIGGTIAVVVIAVVVVGALLADKGARGSSASEEKTCSDWETYDKTSPEPGDEWETEFGSADEASAPVDAAPVDAAPEVGGSLDGAREEMRKAREEAREEIRRAREEAQEEMRKAREEMRRQMQDR